MLGCVSLTWKDGLKLILPIIWGVNLTTISELIFKIISLGAMVGYATYDKVAPALFALLSAGLSFIFVYDIWVFHRTSSYSILYQEQKRKDIVFFKILAGISLAILSFVILVASQTLQVQFQTFTASSAVWTTAGVALSLLWTADLYWFHYREQQDAPENLWSHESELHDK